MSKTTPDIKEAKKHKNSITGKIDDYDYMYRKRVKERRTWKWVANALGVTRRTLYNHWKHNKELRAVSKNHIELSKEALENLDGLLMGDGSLSAKGLSARFRHADSFSEYILFLESLLKSFDLSTSTRINVKQRGGRHYINHIDTKNYDNLVSIYERFYLTKYKYCSSCNILFHCGTVQYSEWKDKRRCPVCKKHYLSNKIVPADIEITPTMLKRWYEGDGSCHRHNQSITINLHVGSFIPSHVDLLIKKFKELGINCTYVNNYRVIQFSKKSDIKKFFDFMGPSDTECYAYKWCTDKELEYQRTPINWSNLDILDILELRKTGVTWSEIGKKYNISSNSLRRKVKAMVDK